MPLLKDLNLLIQLRIELLEVTNFVLECLHIFGD